MFSWGEKHTQLTSLTNVKLNWSQLNCETDLSNPVYITPTTNVLLSQANWQITYYSLSSIRKQIKIDFEYHIYS